MSQNNKPLFLIPSGSAGQSNPSIFLLDEDGSETYGAYRGAYCKGDMSNPSSYLAGGNSPEDAEICRRIASEYAGTTPPATPASNGGPAPSGATQTDVAASNSATMAEKSDPNNKDVHMTPYKNLDAAEPIVAAPTRSPVNAISSGVAPTVLDSSINSISVGTGAVLSAVFGAAVIVSFFFLLIRYVRKRNYRMRYAEKLRSRSLKMHENNYPGNLGAKGSGYYHDSTNHTSSSSPTSHSRRYSAASSKHSNANRVASTYTVGKVIYADGEALRDSVKHAGPLDSIYISSGPSLDINSLYNTHQFQSKKSMVIPELYSSEGTHSLKVNKSSPKSQVDSSKPQDMVQPPAIDQSYLEHASIFSRIGSIAGQNDARSDLSLPPPDRYRYQPDAGYNSHVSSAHPPSLIKYNSISSQAQPSIYGLFGKNNIFQRDYGASSLTNPPRYYNGQTDKVTDGQIRDSIRGRSNSFSICVTGSNANISTLIDPY